jgi:hypothetical protein
MLKEAVFRSPKWMRNFLDFEVNTGQDIKGEPSKRAILKEWDMRWKECDESDFKEFYGTQIKGERWARYITSTELEEIKKKHRGDMSIWEKFDEWLPGHKIAKKEAKERYKKYEKERKEKEERERYERIKREERERYERIKREERERYEKEQRQKRITKELDDLFSAIVKDFSNNPYSDKYSTPRRNGKVCFDYKFENGDTFDMCDNKINYKNSTYTVGLIYRNKFVNLCNEIVEKGRTRPGGSKSWSGGSSSGSGSRYSSKTKSNDPNRDRYDKLMDNIKLREQQLRKMSKTDPERSALENELDNYKRAAERMKTRHKFENIKSFVGFFKY